MLDVSSKEDMMHLMAKHPSSLLSEIDAFLAETGMGEQYFGKAAVGNSELVPRLRQTRKNGKPRSVVIETADAVRRFMADRRRGDAA